MEGPEEYLLDTAHGKEHGHHERAYASVHGETFPETVVGSDRMAA